MPNMEAPMGGVRWASKSWEEEKEESRGSSSEHLVNGYATKMEDVEEFIILNARFLWSIIFTIDLPAFLQIQQTSFTDNKFF